MTASKSILTVTTLAFALMFGGGVYVLSHLNTLAKPRAERIASDAMGVPVTIERMEIMLKEKRVEVHNIRIANPDGYSKPHAVIIEKADVALNTASKALIDFNGIALSGTEVFVEVKQNGTNLHALKNGMRKPQGNQDTLKTIVRRFALNPSQLHPSVTLISTQDLEPVGVGAVVLNNIGTAEKGLPARDVVAQIMRPVLQKYMQAAGNAGYYRGLSSDVLEKIGASELEQFKTQVREDVDKIGEGLKKLFD